MSIGLKVNDMVPSGMSPDALNTTKPSSTSCSALTQNSLSTVPGAGSLPPLQM